MPLFRLEKGKVKRVDPRDFQDEDTLQKLVDENLEDITGVRLVASQFNIPNGRIDTLGIDERNVPVIIEYKWKRDPAAIIQGLYYLNWVRENRKTFELLVKDRLGKGVKVNWASPPRLLIVAKDFDSKELTAINQMAPAVELKKYSYYGDLINIDDAIPLKVAAPSAKAAPGAGEEPTIDDLLKKASPELKNLFLTLRERILALGEDVREKVGPWYCDYRKSSTFASPNVQVRKNRLLIYIKMGEKEVNDPQGMTTRGDFGLGKLNTKFFLDSIDRLDYAMSLIKQAYDYVP